MSCFILELFGGHVSVISLEPLILKSLLSWVSKQVWVTQLPASWPALLLEMIANSAVQSYPRTFFRNAILFIDTFNGT